MNMMNIMKSSIMFMMFILALGLYPEPLPARIPCGDLMDVLGILFFYVLPLVGLLYLVLQFAVFKKRNLAVVIVALAHSTPWLLLLGIYAYGSLNPFDPELLSSPVGIFAYVNPYLFIAPFLLSSCAFLFGLSNILNNVGLLKERPA